MQVVKLILQGILLSPVESCPAPVRDIMKKCWSTDPSDRPTFPEIASTLTNIQETLGPEIDRHQPSLGPFYEDLSWYTGSKSQEFVQQSAAGSVVYMASKEFDSCSGMPLDPHFYCRQESQTPGTPTLLSNSCNDVRDSSLHEQLGYSVPRPNKILGLQNPAREKAEACSSPGSGEYENTKEIPFQKNGFLPTHATETRTSNGSRDKVHGEPPVSYSELYLASSRSSSLLDSDLYLKPLDLPERPYLVLDP